MNSTATVHFPAHLEIMKRLRPGQNHISLDTWFEKNFHPGIMAFLTEEIGLTDREMDEEFRIWQEFNENRTPPFYRGFPELLEKFIGKGGLVTVVSHSPVEHIHRHYTEGAPGIEPELIFGWDHDPEKRKPSPWPIERILEKTGVKPSEVLVVDDLKPGVEMARAAGVDVAAAGWGHAVPVIQERMKSLCDYWLPDIPALETLLFAEEAEL